jgi:hypothetical protein
LKRRERRATKYTTTNFLFDRNRLKTRYKIVKVKLFQPKDFSMSGNIRLWVTSFLLWMLLVGSSHATGFTLTINVIGSGTVNRDPTNSIYPSGANVILTAISNDPSWYFSSWSGDATGTANPLNVGMDSNKVITATFQQLPSYTLTLVTNGQGTIGLNPPGGVYPSNTAVTVTATAATGWVFTAWSGGASGSANPLSITMNTNNSLTGTFAQLPAFDTQPAGVTNVAGSTVGFTSHAVGTAPLGYQWFFSGGSLTHATNTTQTTLTLTNVQSANAGNYWIIATNNYGSATSSVVKLVITNSIGTTNVVNSPDEASLRAAINIGGWVSLGFNGTVTIASTININNNVILDGRNVSATISGGNAVRLFTVAPGATLTMTNLTLANGSCLVTNGTLSPAADAGAIYNNGGTVTLVGCLLTNNLAAKYNYSTINVATVARGGAIFNNGGIVSLFGTSISNNTTMSIGGNLNVGLGTSFGGAIYNTNGTVTIAGCTVSSNQCYSSSSTGGESFGGAAFQASGSLLISNSAFAGNLAAGSSNIGVGPAAQPGLGGALAVNGGTLTIDHCQFTGNAAIGGNAYHYSAPAFGGAVYCAAVMTAKDSTFSGNQAYSSGWYIVSTPPQCEGGAVYNTGSAVFNRCSIYSNLVRGMLGQTYIPGTTSPGGDALGGGIFNASQFVATNCTIALNSVFAGSGTPSAGPDGSLGANGNALGGGIYNSTSATSILMNVTIASNYCIANGAGFSGMNGFAAGVEIANNNGTLRLHNSLIAYGGTNGNATGTITDDGFNISSDGSASLFGGASYNYTDPKLAPLGDYGGPTPCMALLSSSPAIDFGDSAGLPATDQRGFVRPFGAGPDMGAYEYGSFLFINPNLNISPANSNVLLTFTAAPPYAYRLQASTNLFTWSDLNTNGPFATATNISQTISQQGFSRRFFQLLLQ